MNPKPLVKFTPQRLPERRKRMTLISAFRAPKNPTGPNGIVVCADSQETVTRYDEHGQPYDLRVAVQKIEPIYQSESVQVAIAGAGNAFLIEGFIELAKREFGKGSDPNSIIGLRDLLEKRLKRFYKNEVAHCQDDDKQFRLFIMASCPASREYDLWASEYSVLKSPKFPALIGWEHAMYVNTAARLSKDNLTLSQAVLASIYTLTVAKQTSNYIGGDLSVAVINGSGIWMEQSTYVKEMEKRLDIYESKVTNLFLDCADTSVPIHALTGKLNQFSETVVAIHRGQINAYLQGMTLKQVAQANEPYPKTPLGMHVVFGADGKLQHVEHDPSNIPNLDEHARKAKDHFLSMGLIEYVIKRVSEDKFAVLLSGRWDDKPDTLIDDLTRQQLTIALSGAKPFNAEEMLAYLSIDGSEFVVYADPIKLSGSQRLADLL